MIVEKDKLILYVKGYINYVEVVKILEKSGVFFENFLRVNLNLVYLRGFILFVLVGRSLDNIG